MAASTHSKTQYALHECSSGCDACRAQVRSIFRFLRLLGHFQAEEIKFLRARLAKLENASDTDEEQMQIDAIDDDLGILEASLPVSVAATTAASAAASNAAVAKKSEHRLTLELFCLSNLVYTFLQKYIIVSNVVKDLI